MNLFGSEDHIRNWAGFEDGIEEGAISLNDLVRLFSDNYFRRRMDPDWVSRSREYAREMVMTFKEGSTDLLVGCRTCKEYIYIKYLDTSFITSMDLD